MTSLLNDSDDSSGTDDSSISDLDDNDFSLSTGNTSVSSSLNGSPLSFNKKLYSWMNETEGDKLPSLNGLDFTVTSDEDTSDEDRSFNFDDSDNALPRFHIAEDIQLNSGAGRVESNGSGKNKSVDGVGVLRTASPEDLNIKSLMTNFDVDDEMLQINKLQEENKQRTQGDTADALSGRDALVTKLHKVQANQQQLSEMVASIPSSNVRKVSPGAFSPVRPGNVTLPSFVGGKKTFEPKTKIGENSVKDGSGALNDLYLDLKKEKENISIGMKTIKNQIRQLKAEYPGKPRPPSIASTLNGMEKNFKAHKQRLEKVFETEKALYHEPGNDDDCVNSDDSAVDRRNLEPITPKKTAEENASRAAPSQSQEKLRLASEINDLARRLRKMDGGETVLSKIEARSAKKEKKSISSFFGMCCGEK
jgi:hypothetical protein